MPFQSEGPFTLTFAGLGDGGGKTQGRQQQQAEEKGRGACRHLRWSHYGHTEEADAEEERKKPSLVG
ncbi:hypothetical protein E2C01_066222 [Portunus trituberculatus]|uniref:Uncharacterized protein n=1 Tax=Portunus trituberculatus TaxID=210409 RepID=A0A5B7HHN2_PORTR|nr:hypothetical protein [Portunus trituberculatus]